MNTANNTFTGKTSIQGGTLLTAGAAYLSNAGAPGVFGAPPVGPDATIDLHNGVTLQNNGSNPRVNQSTDRPLNLAGTDSGTVSIKYNDNDASLTFGGVTATGTGPKTLALFTGINGNGDREAMIFTGAIDDSSDGSPTSLAVTFNTQGSPNWVSLNGVNTFTGPITLTQINGTANGVLVVGGVRTAGFSSTNTVGTGSLGSGNYPEAISLGARTVFEYDSTATQTLAGVISGAGAMQVTGSGQLTLSGANTYSGNTTVNSGCSLVLDTAGSMTFKLGNTTANKLTGAGTATLNGTFNIDTTAVTTAVATWTLVDIANKTYTPGSFSVADFTGSAGVWTKTVGPTTWTFTEATGQLTLSTLAVFTSFIYPGSVAVIDNSLFTVSLTVPYGTDYASIAPTYTLSSGMCDKPNSSVPTPNFAVAVGNTVTYTITDGISHPYAVSVTTGPAPILFGASGAPLQTFDAAPTSSSEWATLSVTPNNAAVGETAAGIDTIMSSIPAGSINATILSKTGGGTSGPAYWRSENASLETRPTGNTATLLMAKLYNESGSAVPSVLLSYTFGLVSQTPAEAFKGHRVYWSKTGATGSWTAVGDVLRTVVGSATANLTLAPLDWANGETLFVVWADDNGNANPDGDYTIDNVSFTPLPAAPFGLTAISGDAQVALTWAAYPSATSYKVKRSVAIGGPYTPVGTPTETSFTDSPLVNGTPYFYVVSAMTGAAESGDSTEVSVTPSGVDASLSTVVAPLSALWADGLDSSTITVTVRNSSGTPLAGKTVTLASNRVGVDTITPDLGGVSDANGVVVFTVQSATVTEPGTPADFTATADALALTTLASVNFLDPTVPLAINLNIDNAAKTGLFGPAGGLDAIWNRTAATSAVNLFHASGPRTTVGFSSSGTSWGGPDAWGSPTLQILALGLRNFDTSVTNSQQLVIDGLTSGSKYDLYIASANCSDQMSRGVWSTPNVTTTAGDQPCDNSGGINGATWVEGNNYVAFKNVEADVDGKIIVNGHSLDGYRLPLSGFQLTDANSGATGYDAWTTQYAGGQTAEKDFNNDGVQNGVAYFMGENGRTTNPGVVDGKVTWPYKNTVTSFEVQVSDDLIGWTAATSGVDTSDPAQVVYTLLPSATPQKFCRLVVTP
jgi:autotransporter-associated beta strand protein